MPTQFTEDDLGEVFGALADDIRVNILRFLRTHPEETASFSTLQDATGVEDSGRFNYHLGKLTDRFVRKSEAGYELTQAGKHVVGSIESGRYTTSGEIEPIELTDPCRFCGETQQLSYCDEVVTVECTSCSATYEFVVPPAVFAHCDDTDVPRLASRHLRTTIQRQYAGFCVFCNGRLARTVKSTDEFDSSPIRSDEQLEETEHPGTATVEFDCQQCGATAYSSVSDVLLEHPSVIGFYNDHAIDVHERYCWSFPAFDDVDMTAPDESRDTFEITYHCEGESLSLTVDDHLSVLDTERLAR
ncbi:transcriptional regulator [Halobiforma lacisalsi AJ5]|uniref:Transcriptional regulator n=1 Tax=Natronobacterium lacisalsi AJ5 TaxID=358396 RepID=M0L7Y4_NATLA|nr:winged helix-turn-helix domain-containing protein [Halobiforma lacisalsi]APW98414.1 transcriptional regulator [Halobiforma lacisalsi AJ5]EMA28025.1 hypothetical protein C445_20297 [Halobiforma lacisalsi AJ5]